MHISKKTSKLNISIDNGEHAKYYVENRRPGADIYEFDVPKWFDDMVQEYTIPQEGYKNNPLNQGGNCTIIKRHYKTRKMCGISSAMDRRICIKWKNNKGR